ncbi:MAG: protein jag [Eubacteriales bacterium]|nr:protein jag [Eubacteriales bacterium]
MRSIESKAKTMEDAVTSGLEKLGVSFADVKIDILDEGSKGFLGILGSKPVVVRLTVKEDLESVAEPAVKKTVEKPEAAKEKAARPAKTPAAPKPVKAEQPPKARVKNEGNPQAEARAEEFVRQVTTLMGVNVTIDVRRDEEENVRVDMHGDTLGILIGRRGETLDALQYLTSLYVNKGVEGYTRVTLDTENYRAKREEALTRLANRMANRAVKTGRKVVMEPMNPYERRILHSALQKNDAVETHSEGEEPNRHVVITVK